MRHQWSLCVLCGTQWSVFNFFISPIYDLSLFPSKALDSPVATFDCKTGKEILVIPYLIFTASDNPMHAEQTSHAGLCANHFCRTCDVGGTKVYKKSNEGFAKIFEASILLFACDTCDFTSFLDRAFT